MVKIFKIKKGIILNLILLFSSILVLLFLLEIFLRLFYPQPLNPSFIPTTDRGTFAEYDSILGWKLKPNVDGKFFSGEFQTDVHNNKQGLRMNRNVSLEKTKYRIAILGDSIIWGFGVDETDRISELLEKKLKNVEVINFGVSGYGPDQEYLLLNNVVLKFNPDMVIVAFYANDFLDSGNNVRYGYPKPLFKIKNDSSLELTNVPVPKLKEWNKSNYSIFLRINFFLSYKSHAYALFKPLVNSIYHMLMERTSKINAEAPSLSFDIDIIRKGYSGEYEQYKKINDRLFCEMSDLLKQRNTSFVVLNIPHKTHVITSLLDYRLKKYNLSIDKVDINKPSAMLYNLSISCGYGFIDLYPYFKEYKNKNELYFKFDEHLSVQGNEYSAEILSDKLKTFLK